VILKHWALLNLRSLLWGAKGLWAWQGAQLRRSGT